MPSAHANDVVVAAAQKGIKLTPSFVYAIRAIDKRNGIAPKVKPSKQAKTKGKLSPRNKPKGAAGAKRGPKSKAAPPAEMPMKKTSAQGSIPPAARDPRHEFVQLVMRIGTDEAQRLIDAVVDVQTPLKAMLKR